MPANAWDTKPSISGRGRGRGTPTPPHPTSAHPTPAHAAPVHPAPPLARAPGHLAQPGRRASPYPPQSYGLPHLASQAHPPFAMVQSQFDALVKKEEQVRAQEASGAIDRATLSKALNDIAAERNAIMKATSSFAAPYAGQAGQPGMFVPQGPPMAHGAGGWLPPHAGRLPAGAPHMALQHQPGHRVAPSAPTASQMPGAAPGVAKAAPVQKKKFIIMGKDGLPINLQGEELDKWKAENLPGGSAASLPPQPSVKDAPATKAVPTAAAPAAAPAATPAAKSAVTPAATPAAAPKKEAAAAAEAPAAKKDKPVVKDNAVTKDKAPTPTPTPTPAAATKKEVVAPVPTKAAPAAAAPSVGEARSQSKSPVISNYSEGDDNPVNAPPARAAKLPREKLRYTFGFMMQFADANVTAPPELTAGNPKCQVPHIACPPNDPRRRASDSEARVSPSLSSPATAVFGSSLSQARAADPMAAGGFGRTGVSFGSMRSSSPSSSSSSSSSSSGSVSLAANSRAAHSPSVASSADMWEKGSKFLLGDFAAAVDRGGGRDRGRRGGNNSHSQGGRDGRQGRPSSEPKLKHSENAWQRPKEAALSPEERILKKAKGILNKLTIEKFESLSHQLVNVGITTATLMDGLIALIFDKALSEAHFCEMYAKLCLVLAATLPQVEPAPDADGKPRKKVAFRSLLLVKCQQEFEAGLDKSGGSGAGDAEEADKERLAKAARAQENADGMTPEEMEELRRRKRMLCNMQFVGELFNKQMVTETVMRLIVGRLLANTENPSTDDMESVCKLLSVIGRRLEDNPKNKDLMARYFTDIRKLSESKRLPARIRFALKDLMDMRKNGWQARREAEGPKRIDDIHSEAAARDAEQARQSETALRRGAMRSNYGGNSGGSSSGGKQPFRTQGPAQPLRKDQGQGRRSPGLGAGAPVQRQPGDRAAPPRGSSSGGSSGRGARAPGAKVALLSEDAVESSVNNILAELRNEGDVEQAVSELSTLLKKAENPGRGIERILEVAMEAKKREDREDLADLLGESVKGGALSSAELSNVFASLLELLDEFAVDVPAAPTALAEVLGYLAATQAVKNTAMLVATVPKTKSMPSTVLTALNLDRDAANEIGLRACFGKLVLQAIASELADPEAAKALLPMDMDWLLGSA